MVEIHTLLKCLSFSCYPPLLFRIAFQKSFYITFSHHIFFRHLLAMKFSDTPYF